MIKILTLFLGLSSGLHPVDFQVTRAVTQVEVYLDGTSVRTLESPPWSLDLDLGNDLEPHVLVAVARDPQGNEVGRDRRLINLSQVPTTSAPGLGQEATAVAIELTTTQTLPEARNMDGWFLAHGQPVKVLRIDEGPAKLMVVRDPAAQMWIERLAGIFIVQQTGRSLPDGMEGADLRRSRESFLSIAKDSLGTSGATAMQYWHAWEAWVDFLSTDGAAELRFISPLAAPASTVAGRKKIFNISPPLDITQDGFLYHSTRLRPLEFDLRVADALAIAGWEASASAKPRAVLAILTNVPMGRSRYRPEEVRHYLATLGVPLFIWSFDEAMPQWNATEIYHSKGEPTRLSPAEGQALLKRVREAFVQVRQTLNQQRVAWLAGTHRPQDIELSSKATDLVLAGRAATVKRDDWSPDEASR